MRPSEQICVYILVRCWNPHGFPIREKLDQPMAVLYKTLVFHIGLKQTYVSIPIETTIDTIQSERHGDR